MNSSHEFLQRDGVNDKIRASADLKTRPYTRQKIPRLYITLSNA